MRAGRLLFLKEPENIVDDDLDEMTQSDDKIDMPRDSVLRRQGAQTYKFADLATLIVDKDQNLEFDDLDVDDSNQSDSEYGHDEYPGVASMRAPRSLVTSQESDKSLEILRRVSVGNYAPGIKVRDKAEIMANTE